jgi:hypothetical protein
MLRSLSPRAPYEEHLRANLRDGRAYEGCPKFLTAMFTGHPPETTARLLTAADRHLPHCGKINAIDAIKPEAVPAAEVGSLGGLARANSLDTSTRAQDSQLAASERRCVLIARSAGGIS